MIFRQGASPQTRAKAKGHKLQNVSGHSKGTTSTEESTDGEIKTGKKRR